MPCADAVASDQAGQLALCVGQLAIPSLSLSISRSLLSLLVSNRLFLVLAYPSSIPTRGASTCPVNGYSFDLAQNLHTLPSERFGWNPPTHTHFRLLPKSPIVCGCSRSKKGSTPLALAVTFLRRRIDELRRVQRLPTPLDQRVRLNTLERGHLRLGQPCFFSFHLQLALPPRRRLHVKHDFLLIVSAQRLRPRACK